jgi:ribosomal protein L16 Arg81 hydroxylase
MNLIEPVDPAALARAFPHDTFAIRHHFADHPLFTLPRIIELLRTLPRDRIEFNAGNAAIDQDPATTPAIDLAPEEIVRRIETCNAWMVLKRVETEPAYRALLEGVLETVARARGFNGLADAGFSDIQGFLFVSSPHSTTPFHADNEDNFFVQVHGEKFFHVYDNRDRSIASDDLLEDVVAKHRNLHYEPMFDARATHYRLNPGDGIFVPYQWPHYVQTGDSYSISLAMTWKSEEVRRRNDVFVVNSMLRGLGLPQRPPGRNPALDTLKVAALRIAAALAEPLRRSETMRRALRRVVLGKKANYYYGGTPNRPSAA